MCLPMYTRKALVCMHDEETPNFIFRQYHRFFTLFREKEIQLFRKPYYGKNICSKSLNSSKTWSDHQT